MQRSAGNHAVAGLISRQYPRSAVGVPPVIEQPRPVEPAAQETSVAAAPTVQRNSVVQRSIGDSILETVSGWAKEIPGYHLMTLILGRDPISGAAVERNAMNVAHGILSIVPGGNKTFENLQQSGALERFFDWVSGEFGKLGLTFDSIKQLFKQAWDALSVTDLLEPSDAWNKVKGIFGPPLGRIKDFAIAAGKKVLEFILEGVLKLAGPLGEQVMALLKKGGDIFNKIVEDPIGFLGNLLKAVKGGFEGFMDHIAEHLKSGLMGWLFGALAGAGLTLPKTFDLKGILSLVLQVLGLTYQNLRGKMVKVLGEKTVGYIETAVTFVKTLVTEGLAGAWKMIVEWVGSLKDMVLGAIQDWVVTSIVKAAVMKLVTMFNPVGAIIQGIITIYNTISFFIERAQQIGAVVGSIFDSVGRIAAGDVGGAAQFVEQTMAKAVPVMIGFLASLIGLGGIGNTIRGIIQKIQAPIEKALDKVVGFISQKAKALWGKLTGTADKDHNASGKNTAPTSAAQNGTSIKEIPFDMAGEKHTLYIEESPGKKIEVLMASRNKDRVDGKFTAVTKLLKDYEKAIDEMNDPVLKAEFKDKMSGPIEAMIHDDATSFVKRLEAVSTSKDRQAILEEITPIATELAAMLTKWAQEHHVRDMSPEAVKEREEAEAEKIWRGKQAEVQAALQGFVPRIEALDSAATLQYGGSLARGYKHKGKGFADFDANAFDVDAFVVSAKLVDRALDAGARPEENKIWASRSQIPELQRLVREMRTALAAIGGMKRRGTEVDFDIVLRTPGNVADRKRRAIQEHGAEEVHVRIKAPSA
jgi:hypothetical protein